MFAGGGGALLLVAAAMLVVFLAENARIPVDDPNTHLELTMIHEAMVLDHGGPDLAMIEYASAVKLWVIGALLVGIVAPGNWAGGSTAFPGCACTGGSTAFPDCACTDWVVTGWKACANYMASTALAMGSMVGLAIATGVIESTMARLRLKRVPQLLVAAGVLSVLAMALSMRSQ
jgi:formate hydrogenlyase subunit 4